MCARIRILGIVYNPPKKQLPDGPTIDEKYAFHTNQFGINPEGVHLLRNNFNYQLIPFIAINSITIRKGKDFRNWPLMLAVGLIFMAFAVYHTMNIVDFFQSDRGGTYYLETLILPFFPALFGVLLVVLSFRTTMGIELVTDDKKHWLSLRSFVKAGSMADFATYLRSLVPAINIQFLD